MACPICGNDTQASYRPFCSNRCADLDLGRWLTGQYAIPAMDEAVDESDLEEGENDLRNQARH